MHYEPMYFDTFDCIVILALRNSDKYYHRLGVSEFDQIVNKKTPMTPLLIGLPESA
jgi:hypothetical protein